MEKILGIIGVAMAVVFVGAVLLTAIESGEREAQKNVALFDIAPSAVDSTSIEGPAGAEAHLLRRDGSWILPDLGDFPADDRKVGDALTRLLAITARQPAGSSESDLAAFRLAGDDFERRITFSAANKVLATLFLGTPLGPRHVHARRADQAMAYDVAFGLYDAPADAAEWIDKGALRIAPGDMAALDVAGLHLLSTAPGAGDEPVTVNWQLAGGDGAVLRPTAAAHLADLLAELQVENLIAPDVDPTYSLDAPALELSLTLKDGRRIDYRLGKAASREEYILAVSTWPQRFHLLPYTARRLVDAANQDRLLGPAGQHATLGSATATQHN